MTLNDGGTLRGTIVTQEPGRQVEILVLGETTPRVVPWADVRSVDRGKYVAHSSASSAHPAPPKGPPGLGDPGIVALHITSPVPVDLFGHAESFGQSDSGHTFVLDTSVLLCTSPCDARIDTRVPRPYTVVGPDAVQSEPFALNGMSGNQELIVSPGNPTVRGVGALFAALGATATGVGLILTIAGAAISSDDKSAPKLVPAGLVTLGSGVVSLIGGIIMVAATNTTVQVHPSDPPGTRRAARAPRYWAGEF